MENEERERIEYMTLTELQRWPDNPKDHDLGELHTSMDRFGYTNPILIDETSGMMVGGHGRLEVLEQKKRSGMEPPKRVVVREDGEWLVPVIRGIGFKDYDEAVAYAMADNRLVELGGWDDAKTAEIMTALALQGEAMLKGTGFTPEDVDELRRRAFGEDDEKEKPDPEPKIDQAEELVKKYGVQDGQIWELDSGHGYTHRVVCGDSSSPVVVGKLFGGARGTLLATDPPYGIDYDSAVLHHNQTDYDEIENDNMTGDVFIGWLENIFRLWSGFMIPNPAWYVWHPMKTQVEIRQTLERMGMLVHREIIWAKPQLVFGRGDYHWMHESCFYGWPKSFRPKFYGERNQTSVWQIGYKEGRNERMHPTEKPVELFEIPVLNHTRPGEVCVDMFMGSGSHLIAADRNGRAFYGADMEPKWVAVSMERWAEATGGTPKLVESFEYEVEPDTFDGCCLGKDEE